ncbi:MAG TPA: RNA polymerase sigma factor [Vicinamibacterales bacterium]|jgi:RNA polymerase sigma-70 factor (ECF subfamily)|nr:RNA polymerase sigma factor [Vicinamibacterales bacterium]
MSKGSSVFGASLPASLLGYGAESTASTHEEVLHLFDECAPGLRRYVGAFGLTAEVTEDVVQEVFLQLFRHLRLGRSRANLRGWIFRVGHNQALKHREKAARRHRWEGTWDVRLVDRVIDPAANPEQQLADDRRVRRLRAVVRALPERDRQCLFLRAEGLGYRDIAKTLNISLGGVAKSLARTMTRLTNADGG